MKNRTELMKQALNHFRVKGLVIKMMGGGGGGNKNVSYNWEELMESTGKTVKCKILIQTKYNKFKRRYVKVYCYVKKIPIIRAGNISPITKMTNKSVSVNLV